MNNIKNFIFLAVLLIVAIIVIAYKKNQYDYQTSLYEFKDIGPIGNNKLTEYDESISLIKNIYNQDKKTFYCNCEYENNLKIKKDLCPFTFDDKTNEPKVVWENIVPVREISKSKYVLNDLYNFIPVVKKMKKGNSPNNLPKKFSNCSIKKNNNTYEPPNYIKGDIARTYLYMNWAYPELQLFNKKQHELMKSWNNIDPVDQNECTRAWKILNKQKNENPFVRKIYKKKSTPSFIDGSWTLVVIPDTQRITDLRTEPSAKIFKGITNWIAENKVRRNIKFVLHVGDITGGNSVSSSRPNGNTWQIASDAFKILEDANIPYSIAIGNHDYDLPKKPAASRDATHVNKYFSTTRYKKMNKNFGYFEDEKTENHYHLLEINKTKYIIITLELAPRNEVLRWANNILQTYKDRTAIINTHVHTFEDGSRYDWKKKNTLQYSNPHTYKMSNNKNKISKINVGQEVWDKLIYNNENIKFIFSGHIRWGGARQEAIGKNGNMVHEIVAAYHDPISDLNITDYIRLIEFHPNQKIAQVKTYSPRFNEYMTDKENQFKINIDINKKYPPNTIKYNSGLQCQGYKFLYK